MVNSTIRKVLKSNCKCTKITTIGTSDPGQNNRTLDFFFNGHRTLDEQAEEKKVWGLYIFYFTAVLKMPRIISKFSSN